ncbi:hypothetical protein [Polymorphospora rubra]|uniref:Uncharacterized protein n=1 Tax=Polymorphospora rubra TaxID=338584 RepID=A0A810MXH3_9ACTN|nr:hypothetical protein [Polymorphospora rubra]BCJ64095.1 hypothetical protein Prubr_11160 [Polymorphospora rubra]
MADVQSMQSVLDGLISRLHPGLGGDALGEILNRLVWLTDDNGADVIAVCRGWLKSGDRRRVEAALSIEEGWLYEGRDDLRTNLLEVGSQWPHLMTRVEEILCLHDSQFGR